jgi:AhpD family alkylhydroperoxidase
MQRIDYPATAPAGVKALGSVYGYVQSCGLPHSLVELTYLRVSQINGCAFCIDMHTRALLELLMSAEKLMLVSVWREAGQIFDDLEQAALGWAEVVTQISNAHPSDDQYDQVRAVFSEKETVDLTIAIGLMNTYNRLAISMGRVPKFVTQE